ncbi:hypothetical protein NUU61_007178 [Penicillium alfredii]|uniref:Zn(2)-C6 fungal-type domain-containing protein n=1 Tax=Penicillium alfredii TaxID=1506179 RepID=A0A9W9K406_9EURO|nr:uncharacterized protein NUU61_007178 [Penicillium alfredii]KAJ5092308.1 hypothetical protein NUU61_007178 [Penicillium alfredii]
MAKIDEAKRIRANHHKKCDEARPSCRRCIDSDRVCDGYESPEPKARSAKGVPQRAVSQSRTGAIQAQTGHSFKIPNCFLASLVDASQIDLTPRERWHLNAFRTYTSAECAGYVHDEFWQRLVHQVSEEQPAIRHAAIAISALHRRFALDAAGRELEPESQDGRDSLFSLRQGSKAIAHLRQTLTKHPYAPRGSTETALVGCVLLVSLASLQQDERTVCLHLRSGYKLLEEWQKVNFNDSPAGPILLQTFAQLHLNQSTFTDPVKYMTNESTSLASLVTNNPQISGTIDNTDPGSDAMVILGWIVSQNCPQGFELDMSPATSVQTQQPTVFSKLQFWRSQLSSFVLNHSSGLLQRDYDALKLVELWCEITHIMVVMASQPGQTEMGYDGLLSHFQWVVYLAGFLIESSSPQPATTGFSAKIGVIPALFFCGQKCRDWHLRREALRLLRSKKRQEGIWRSSDAALVLQKLIDVESEGACPEMVIPEPARLTAIDINIFPESSQVLFSYQRPRVPDPWEKDAGRFWENVLLSH